MRIGRYHFTKNSILNSINEKFFRPNSKAYWEGRFKRDWVSSGGRLQTSLFATGFALNVATLQIDKGVVRSILDFGCGTGDSVPILKMAFPDASITAWDFSRRARAHAKKEYSELATVPDESPEGKFDLVYCSNVIEHIEQLDTFFIQLCSLTRNYLVIQAPHNEYGVSGNEISLASPCGEHVQTINESKLINLDSNRLFDWQYITMTIPYAWDKGRQLIMRGQFYDCTKINK